MNVRAPSHTLIRPLLRMVTLVVLLACRTSGIRAVRRERGVRRGACVRVGRRGDPSAPRNNSSSIFGTFAACSSQTTPTLTRSGSGDRRGLLRTHAFGCRLSRSFALVTCGCRHGTIEHANRARIMTVIVVCVHAILWALVLFIILPRYLTRRSRKSALCRTNRPDRGNGFRPHRRDANILCSG